ncbi:methyltransferase family protein [Sinobaca qinghaiensis]|uniref:Methyltransferase family protein n=1 Tax=Sinobaca qinghaiensis TaxID=342944 RepID=A0A419UWM9_9BACL|nr:class I SAM-dependent methyltransferase [Sinobaca qinghaiensis]RKD69536.1 methyltransferase family protein [Sinobaca qinghaiensis]
MASFYGSLSAEVYDFDKYIGKSYGDVEYYSERLRGTTGKILEPAVGNGRILLPLLEKGLYVEGFDLSTNMLDLCRQHLTERKLQAALFLLDMAEFELNERYGAVIVPTGSFLLVHNRSESISALQCFYRHLNKGGRLMIDIFLPENFNPGFISKRTFENERNETITLEETLVEVDYIHQVTWSHHKYEKWNNNKLVDTELEVFPLRWYGVEEFALVLKEIGFREIVVSADYNYGSYPDNDTRMITFEAVKY